MSFPGPAALRSSIVSRTNLSQPGTLMHPTITVAIAAEGTTMQHRAWLRAEHYREIATRFRLMAEIEPLASLRRHLRRLAAQHDELAAGLETAQHMNQDNPR